MRDTLVRQALPALLFLLAHGAQAEVHYFPLPPGTGAHDVAPSPTPQGPVYFTAQRTGQLGILNPVDGKVDFVDLGKGSAPHGVVVGPDGLVWLTDGGRNSLQRFDPATRALREWPLPPEAARANLNTPTVDRSGRLWFTGQSGWYGRLDPASGEVKVWRSPKGAGPYGITTTPQGEVYYASLAGNYLGHIDERTGAVAVLEPPTPQQGARRVWSDSKGQLWVSYWHAGKVGCYDPASGRWKEWSLPGAAHAYAVWVDENDRVWLSDWGANALVRFDPRSERFDVYASDRDGAQVRQLAGRAGEVWGAESGQDRLVRLRIAEGKQP